MNVATTNNIEMKNIFAIFTVLIYNIINCSGQSKEISAKLDFGTSESSTIAYDSSLSTSLVKALVSLQHSTEPRKTIISSKLDQNPFNLRSIAPLALTNSKQDFATLGVICIDGKCNKTSKASSPEEKLSTDILVQVVTNVGDKKNNKTDVTGEDDDVPVVVGYAGTNFKPNNLDAVSRRIDGTEDIAIQTGVDNKHNYNFYEIGKVNDIPKKQFHQVPYFYPSFNNHYFGESQPPQFVWYRRRNGYNPHAFNTNSRPYKFYNQWQLKYPSTPSGWTQTTTCACSNPGLNWYPNIQQNQPTISPGINNKLAPLN